MADLPCFTPTSGLTQRERSFLVSRKTSLVQSKVCPFANNVQAAAVEWLGFDGTRFKGQTQAAESYEALWYEHHVVSPR